MRGAVSDDRPYRDLEVDELVPDHEASRMNSLADVRSDFAHAGIVGRRTVFNIHGNDYRLIARVNYQTRRVFILHILTHVEYSKGDWKR